MTKKREKKKGDEKSDSMKHSEIRSLMVERFRAQPYNEFTLRSMSAVGAKDSASRKMAKDILYSLVDEGFVERTESGVYRLRTGERRIYEGVADMTASGSLYVKVEGLEQDVFINQRHAHHALNGDRIEIEIMNRRQDGQLEGTVTKVLERSKKNYVGVVERTEKYAFVKVDSRKVPMDIFLPPDDATNVQDDDKVLIHIVDWDERSKSPVGKLIRVLGKVGDNDTEMHAILAEYDLPYEFDHEIIDAAESIPEEITKKDVAERRDMRHVTTFTIDPADAKDFDDALSIQKLPSGNWEVGIHIADVTHYVKPSSPVDIEAQERGTSVYLVDRTVPMLPEKLSNNLCSLRPNEEKLCFSVILEMTDQAEIVNRWIGRTVALSDLRMSYEEAQAMIEGGDGKNRDEVLTLNRLAQIIRKQRFQNGAISFEREEAKFELDEKGKPLGVYFKEMKESNQLIEEFMLIANCTVAEHIGKDKNQRTFVYRVHDEPNSEKLERFSKFIVSFGYSIKTDQIKGLSKQMNSLMRQIAGKKEENLISTLAIRTMAKAYYTTDNIGHYGLAFPYYTHFTSPIRRYPDMMVHRLLALYLDGRQSVKRSDIEELCEHSSEREVVAAEAERASIKYKMVEFMQDRIGEVFSGHISGVTEWGLYVELEDTHIEGMVSLRDIDGDFYVFQENEYAVVGHTHGKRYTLGDNVEIRVARADLARKQLDFELAK